MFSFPSSKLFTLLYAFGAACIINGCYTESPDSSLTGMPEAVELEDYRTPVSFEDNLLGTPYIVVFDDYSNHLLVYDDGTKQVLKLDVNGEVNITGTFGGEGQGPGELAGAGNIFATNQHIYITDPLRFFIHQYDRGGEPLSSLDLGVQKRDGSGKPPPPQSLFRPDLYGEPLVTLNGNVMVSSLKNGSSLYELQDWKGSHLANIGSIPEADASSMDDEAYLSALQNREVPLSDKRRVFPVADKAHPDELFLIYGAIPKIAKYDTSGRKLWEKTVPHTPEIDSLVSDHYRTTELGSFQQRWPLRKYVSGVSSPGGDLYLSVYTNLLTPPSDNNRSLWIHRFNSEGELIRRYKLISETDLLYYPGIDFSGRRIFVLPFGEAEIRAYSF